MTTKQADRSRNGGIFDLLAKLSPPGRCASEWQQAQRKLNPAAFEAGYNSCRADLLKKLHGETGDLGP